MVVLEEFNRKMNALGAFPAKDIINQLSKMAQDVSLAPEIVNLMRKKILEASVNCKLPLFYLMDSILKNVGNVYITLFGKCIVELYTSCVTQPGLNTKDRQRFVHVLRTWEKTRLFPSRDVLKMRQSLSQDTQLLRRLLTRLQNEMNVHPTQHLTLEQVQSTNPAFYQQLLAYRDAETKKTKKPTPEPRSSLDLLNSLRQKEKPSKKKKPIPDPKAVMSILKKLQQTSTKPSASKIELILCKTRMEKNIQMIYAALPLISRQSGVRFTQQQDLDKHLDFLFQYNRAQRDKAKGGISRSWYPTMMQWATDFKPLSHESRAGTASSFFELQQKATVDEPDREDHSMVPADESITKCRICGETFTKFWNEEEEEWMYRNAVHGVVENATPGGSNKESIFHKHCYDAAKKHSAGVQASQLAPGTPPPSNWAQAAKRSAAMSDEMSDQSKKPKLS